MLYKERRFCKLDSCFNAIIQALPILEQFLEEAPTDNLLAQGSRIYLKCEVFILELILLAYFNHHVVSLSLHTVEIVTITGYFLFHIRIIFKVKWTQAISIQQKIKDSPLQVQLAHWRVAMRQHGGCMVQRGKI